MCYITAATKCPQKKQIHTIQPYRRTLVSQRFWKLYWSFRMKETWQNHQCHWCFLWWWYRFPYLSFTSRLKAKSSWVWLESKSALFNITTWPAHVFSWRSWKYSICNLGVSQNLSPEFNKHSKKHSTVLHHCLLWLWIHITHTPCHSSAFSTETQCFSLLSVI